MEEKRFVTLEPLLATWLFFTAAFCYWEACLHYIMHRGFDANAVYIALFSMMVAGVINYVLSFMGKRASDIVGFIILVVITVYYFVQNVYFRTFGTVMPLSVVKIGGDALTNFSKETISIIVRFLPSLIAVLAPLLIFPPYMIFLKKKEVYENSKIWGRAVFSGVLSIMLYILSMMGLMADGMGDFTPYDMYFSATVATETSAEVLGTGITSIREVSALIFGGGKSAFDADDLTVVGGSKSDEEASVQDETVDTAQSVDESLPEEVEIIPEDLGVNGPTELKLPRVDGNDDINKISAYFEKVEPTNKNEYTGFFKDKNLIMLCCEAFDPVLMESYPEMFPALTKLYTGGFVFNNFYASWPNNTTNGEYTYVTGLFPDMSRGKDDSTMANSCENYYPYVLGNVWTQKGVETYGYHNFRGYYYNREGSYPNMGLKNIKFKNAGLNMSTGWPTSDLEMMQQTVDDYINQDRFYAYYMTFSGHMEYSVENNPMCARNYDKVADMELSEAAKCYLSGHLELEYAMEYLLKRLEEAGRLDDTVIVMTPDHFPYGLTIEEFSELKGHAVDGVFEKYENAFICYNSAMEPVSVDTYCSTIDILPTLLNLFGEEYDSRLLPGIDIFADSEYHMAILSNQNFIDDKVSFNSAKKKTTYKVDSNSLPENYVEDRIQLVKNKVYISSLVFHTDYYSVLK